ATIDTDTDMIRAAATFGFKVYYGDGTRLDILRAAGIEGAEMVVIAIDNKDQTTRIAELIRDEFPLVKVMARAYDRGHAIKLVQAGVSFQIREMFESALTLSGQALRVLGSTEGEIAELLEGVRERDRRRFQAQIVGGLQAGRDLLLSNAEEQARESGAVERKSEPVMLEQPPKETEKPVA
ncbi:MAG TPA: NAD-binding protein, partial [Devosia sp.]|nr:NAD-binding protein [Devosia sp.]